MFPQQDLEQPACRVGAWGPHVCVCMCVGMWLLYTYVCHVSACGPCVKVCTCM